VEKFKIFERLNNEKITPHFLNVAKGTGSKDSDLSIVCNDTGEEFFNNLSRDEYITKTFSDLYLIDGGVNETGPALAGPVLAGARGGGGDGTNVGLGAVDGAGADAGANADAGNAGTAAAGNNINNPARRNITLNNDSINDFLDTVATHPATLN
jgi:hypothetical protein